ncbi:hypothetical protein ACWGOQ_0020130 [Aquimarina sp. M1]
MKDEKKKTNERTTSEEKKNSDSKGKVADMNGVASKNNSESKK